MAKWRAWLVRQRARVLGDVEALTRQEAKLAAITLRVETPSGMVAAKVAPVRLLALRPYWSISLRTL
jgi:hypothetical protein